MAGPGPPLRLSLLAWAFLVIGDAVHARPLWCGPSGPARSAGRCGIDVGDGAEGSLVRRTGPEHRHEDAHVIRPLEPIELRPGGRKRRRVQDVDPDQRTAGPRPERRSAEGRAPPLVVAVPLDDP